MIHLYCGEGKGKTTAAMGLALRMAGHGRRVVIAQFLKSEHTGERSALARLEEVTLLPLPQSCKFVRSMTPAEREAEGLRCRQRLEEASRLVERGDCGLLVLDEVCAAIRWDFLTPESVCALLDRCAAAGTECVLTGRDPHPALAERSDYITEFKKLRHPFDRGVSARSGVEF